MPLIDNQSNIINQLNMTAALLTNSQLFGMIAEDLIFPPIFPPQQTIIARVDNIYETLRYIDPPTQS